MDLYTYLLDKIEKRRIEISDTLMSNGIANMEQYHHLMGQVSAFSDLESIIKEPRKRMETADDD